MQLESVEFHRYWISPTNSCVILYSGSILGWNAVVTSISLLGLTWQPCALCDGHVTGTDGVAYSTTGSDLWAHSVLWEQQEMFNSQNQELNLSKKGTWLSQQDFEPLTEVVLRWCTCWAKRIKARFGCKHRVCVVLQPQKKLELTQINHSIIISFAHTLGLHQDHNKGHSEQGSEYLKVLSNLGPKICQFIR